MIFQPAMLVYRVPFMLDTKCFIFVANAGVKATKVSDLPLLSPRWGDPKSLPSKVVSTHRTGTHPEQPLPTGCFQGFLS